MTAVATSATVAAAANNAANGDMRPLSYPLVPHTFCRFTVSAPYSEAGNTTKIPKSACGTRYFSDSGFPKYSVWFRAVMSVQPATMTSGTAAKLHTWKLVGKKITSSRTAARKKNGDR